MLVCARAETVATDEAAVKAAERRKLRRSIGVSSYAGFSGRAEINATEAAEQGHRGIFFPRRSGADRLTSFGVGRRRKRAAG
jgi:hypothetical protein